MFTAASEPLRCKDLRVTVPSRTLVDGLDLEVRPGEFLAILGRNGTGKSLTLQTMAGLRRPAAGRVTLGTQDVFSAPRRTIAQRLALLPQNVEDIFPSTVLETALIGRHPHISGLRWESRQDVAIATRALVATGLSELAERDVLTLSGGERRRLAIAQVLTQAPGVFMLDEPTNHLDPQHQIDAMRTFRAAADSGSIVIAALHDVNLAVRFADRCLLLFGDGRWRLGAVGDVLNERTLEALYAAAMDAVAWRGRHLFIAGGADGRSADESGQLRQ